MVMQKGKGLTCAIACAVQGRDTIDYPSHCAHFALHWQQRLLGIYIAQTYVRPLYRGACKNQLGPP